MPARPRPHTRAVDDVLRGRYLQPEAGPDLRLQIDPYLIPPTLDDLRASLSEEQQFYTNPDDLVPFLTAFEQLETTPSCNLTLMAEVGTIPVPDQFELSSTHRRLGRKPSPLAGNLAEPGTTVTINMRTGDKF